MRPSKTPDDLRRLSRNILALRLEKKWTQRELTTRSGLNRYAMNRAVMGRNVPAPKTVSALAECLGKTPDDLWLGDFYSEHHIGETNEEFIDRYRAEWARVAAACEKRAASSVRPLLQSEDVLAILCYPSLRTLDRMRARREIGWVRVGGQVRFTREHVEDYLCTPRARPADPVKIAEFGICAERIAAHEQMRSIQAAQRWARRKVLDLKSNTEVRALRKERDETAERPAQKKPAKA